MSSTLQFAPPVPVRVALGACAELLKPITWFAPMWAFGCGVAAAGLPGHGHWLAIGAGVALSGPMVCGTSQAANDWFDRHVDAINEPQRAIPSGRVPGRRGLHLAVGWTVLSLLVAWTLGPWAFGAAVIGLLLAWAYSAPPVRLKRNGWWGNAACGACYEGLPWLTGVAVMTGALPSSANFIAAGLYSFGAHGIMTLNDFKSVGGDATMGIRSLPVQLGPERAAKLACVMMAAPQAVMIALLVHWHHPRGAALVAVLLAAQIGLMVRLLGDPRARAPWYNGTGTTLYVIGMLVTAFRGAAMSWFTIARLGLAQMMLGSMVVIATSTLNRVMVVELALPAIVPGALVGLHYALQVLRPRWGFAAEVGGSGWIVGGMAMLAGGVVMAAAAAGVIGGGAQAGGLALAIAAYALIGLGVGGMGTALLTVLARGVGAARRPAAATCVWLMMIAGSAVTAGVVSQLLVPFSFARLLRVTAGAAAIALAVTAIATPRLRAATGIRKALLPTERFGTALRAVWADAGTRQFAAFVFLSMLAYSAQELILEPFAGLVFGLGPAATAGLIGLQHGGVLAGMLLVALGGSTLARRAGGMRVWTVGGCGASAVALLALAGCGVSGQAALLRPCLLALGVSNGVFAVAAIGAMMQVSAGQTRAGGTGTSMGLFGAAQAVAFGLGGLLSSGASDAARHLLGSPVAAYACVFAAQAGLFAAAAALATRIFAAPVARAARTDGWSRAA